MKKIFFIIITLSIVLYCSCESEREQTTEQPEPQVETKQPETQSWEKLTSLEGTTWKGIEDLGDGAAIISEMTFTDTIATFKSEWQDGKRCSHFSGKYIYNPDKETFVMPNESEQTNWEWDTNAIPDLEGTIENGIMTFDEWISFDVYWTVTLKKQ